MDKMIKFVVVLNSGGDYTSDDVITLARQVGRNLHCPYVFFCLTDVRINHGMVIDIPLETPEWKPKWWSVQEMFRIQGPVLATGLDTVIVGDITPMAEEVLKLNTNQFLLMQPFRKTAPWPWINGFMGWNGDFGWIYDEFKKDPEKYISQFRSEMLYTQNRLMSHGYEILAWQDKVNGLYSYKWQCKPKPPEDIRVAIFHGQPRPGDVNDKWIKDARL